MALNIDAKRLSMSPGTDKAFVFLTPWGYDADFGIVHPCGCAICRNYMLHVSDADAGSYAQAVLERDTEFRNRFFEGFRRGRAAQLEHDTERLKNYRLERNVAREQVSVYEIKFNEVEREVLRLKDELLALRIAYNQYGGPEVSSVHSKSLSSDSDDGYDQDHSNSDSDDGDEYERLSDGTSEGDDTAVENDIVEDDGLAKVPLDAPAVESPKPPPVLSPSPIQEDLDVEGESSPQPPSRPASISRSPLPHSTSASPVPAPASFAVDEIRRKMKLAHLPNQGELLAEIKGLVSKAHKTPHSQRTEVQKVLVLEWRRPSLIAACTPPAPLPVAPAPVEPEEIDVYVDASGSGIGFYLLGRWQAWRLKDGWRIAKCREIQWAEAVAVEMGIRLLLKAGYTGTKIRLHSDNQQVVDGFSTRDIHRSQVGPVVQLYDDLCRSFELDCSIKWIPGAENPADGPSRFLFLDKNKRFPCDITIPPHLQEFVLPYCLPE